MKYYTKSRNLYYLRTYPEEYDNNYNELSRIASTMEASLLVIAAWDKEELASILKDYLINSYKEEYFRWMLVPGYEVHLIGLENPDRNAPILEAFNSNKLYMQWFQSVLLHAFNIGKAIPTVKGIIASEARD